MAYCKVAAPPAAPQPAAAAAQFAPLYTELAAVRGSWHARLAASADAIRHNLMLGAVWCVHGWMGMGT